MMDVLVKAKTGMLGHFFCVVAAFLFVSCGWDLIDSDKEDENACSDKVERSDLMSGVEKIGGYSLHQTVHFVTSDSLQFDMQVTVVDDGYDERGCPDVDIVYGYRRVVLEGPNPLLSMGMSIQNQVYSEASVNIMIGAYNFAFRVELLLERLRYRRERVAPRFARAERQRVPRRVPCETQRVRFQPRQHLLLD